MPLILADGIESILEHPSDNLVMLVLFVGVLLAGLIAIVGAIWYQLRKTEIEACLKRDMIERGMPADEIERVLAAKMGPPKTPALAIGFTRMRFGKKEPKVADKET